MDGCSPDLRDDATIVVTAPSELGHRPLLLLSGLAAIVATCPSAWPGRRSQSAVTWVVEPAGRAIRPALSVPASGVRKLPLTPMTTAQSRFVMVDGIRTHYLEAGNGFPVVLLHSGEYGASGELSWEYNMDVLAEHFRVIAPDWLGFGQTAKLYDFESGSERRVQHMCRFLETIGVRSAFFIGSSMGASVLSRQVAQPTPAFRAEAMILSAGGGFVPNNSARRQIVDYDCTLEGMRGIVEVLFRDPSWAQNG